MRRPQMALRNAAMRQRRADGGLLKNIAAEFGVTLSRVSGICAGVALPRLDAPELSARQARRRKREPIRPDDITRAEIAAALRNPGPPYKSPKAWPA